MRQKVYEFGKLSAKVLLPERNIKTIVYFHDAVERAMPEDLLEQQAAACVLIRGEDWNHDLTPWPAKAVFRDTGDFQGKADSYLETLTELVIPEIENDLGITPEMISGKENDLGFVPGSRILAGVSLAGLFSVYAAYHTNLFDGIASISGSLWYDGFVDYMQAHFISGAVKKAYFSVGDKEKRARNQRMAQVETCTKQAVKCLESQKIKTIFEKNPGNHFVDGELRIRKAMEWLLIEK